MSVRDRPTSAIVSWVYGRLPKVRAVPEGWRLSRLTDVAKLESGHTPDRNVPAYWNGGVQWLSLHDTKHLDESVLRSTVQQISQLGLRNSSARLLPAGTVALSRTATIGKCVILGQEMATSQDFACYICGSSLDRRYLLHLFRYMQPVWSILAEGSTHKTVYMPAFERLQILVPPLYEQRRIVEVLDSVDESIRSTDLLAEKFSIASLTLRRHLLLGKGDAQNRNRATIGDVLARSEYGISDPLEYGHGTPVLRMNNLKDGEVDASDLKVTAFSVPQRLLLSYGDVLFNRTNSIDHVGRTSIWRGPSGTTTFASYLVRLVRDERIILPDYLTLWLNLDEIQTEMRRFATPGVHQVNINPTNLKKVRIEFPRSLEEQGAICQQIAASILPATSARIQVAKLKQLKQGLMEDLLTGQVRVNVEEDVVA